MTDPLALRLGTLRSSLACSKSTEPERLARAMESLGGLSSTEVTASDWTRIKRHLARVNEILARYPIRTQEDYARIVADDLAQIRVQLTRLATHLRAPGPAGEGLRP